MNSLNKVQLIGNLTHDVELKSMQNGTSIAIVKLATNRSVKASDGQSKDYAEYHQVVVFGKMADLCSKYLTKGNRVYFEGRLQTRSWETEEGYKRYKTEVVASSMLFLNPKNKERSYEAMDESEESSTPNEEVSIEEDLSL